MRLTKTLLRILFFQTLAFAALCFGDDTKTPEFSSILATANSLQNLRASGSKPFHLHIQLNAERVVAKPLSGTYDEIWLSPNAWRREITFPEFDQIEVGDQNSTWLSRNLDFRPSVAFLIASAIDAFLTPEISPQETVTSVRNKRNDGRPMVCVESRSGMVAAREMCFDPSGVLASQTLKGLRFEYADFMKFGDHVFPRTIRIPGPTVKENTMTIEVDSLKEPEQPLPEFRHTPDAAQLAPCRRPLTEQPIKKVDPRYPPGALSLHQQGTVGLYVLLSGDGYVKRTKVVESVSPYLDHAALDAVQQWQYAPVQCGAGPLPTEIEVYVNYKLR